MRQWETPVLIPNTMVKTLAADGTLLETARESRWMPELWGYSSVGRAPALQAGGHEFESRYLHLADKTSVITKMRTSRTEFSRSWHYMPMHEKALVLRQASLSHTIVFQALASLCTLKTAYKYMIRNIKTSEVIVITINLI